MPRVNINKKKYAENDIYAFIRVQMSLRGLTQKDLSPVLGDSQQVISRKLKQHTLTITNLITLFDYFGTEEETIGKILKGNWRI